MAPLPQLRRRTRRDMRASLEEYLARNPAAGWDDLVEAFGTPEQAAENVLNGMDAGQILAEAKRYSWRRLAAIVRHRSGLGRPCALLRAELCAAGHPASPDRRGIRDRTGRVFNRPFRMAARFRYRPTTANPTSSTRTSQRRSATPAMKTANSSGSTPCAPGSRCCPTG